LDPSASTVAGVSGAEPAPRLLAGRVAIVTGASGGLGSAICSVFEREGAAVVPVDIQGEGCLHLDVGSEEGNVAMINEALDRFGRLDTLVLNAGVQFMAPIPEFPVEQWDRLMDVMVKGPFLAIKHAWPRLVERPGGRIVVTASGSSFIAEKFKAAYIAAKHAVAGLVKVAALEGAQLGLTANAVAPGWMMTPLIEAQMADQMRLNAKSREELIASWMSQSPVDRAVEPAEVAETIAFLASDRASGINGAVVPVDLGLLVC
jgi:3-hydroxybutyrate dehydrogenase